MRVALRQEELAQRGAASCHDGAVSGRYRHIETERAHDIGEDVVGLVRRVAECADRGAQRLVGDLEVAAAGELLELHERKVGLDARRIAVHQKADRARRRDHGRLRVAEAKLLAEAERVVPAGHGASKQLSSVREIDAAALDDGVVDWHWSDAERFPLVA